MLALDKRTSRRFEMHHFYRCVKAKEGSPIYVLSAINSAEMLPNYLFRRSRPRCVSGTPAAKITVATEFRVLKGLMA